MTKTATLISRVDPEIKAALERAAVADARSLSAMIERILAEWLRRRGYLPKASPRGTRYREPPK